MKTQTDSKRRGRRGLVAIGLAVLMTASGLTIGCQSGENNSGTGDFSLSSKSPSDQDESLPGMMLPTLDELQSVLELTSAQSTAMETALILWETAMTERREARQQARDEGQRQGERGTGEWSGRESPFLAFVEVSADILTTDQFVALIEFLAEWRDTRPERQRAFGQRRKGQPGEHRADFVERFGDALELTDTQREEIEAIIGAYRDAMRELRSGTDSSDRDSFREQLAGMREAMQEEIEAVLDAGQLARLEELRDERHKVRRERHAEWAELRLARHIDFLARVLDLDDAQQVQFSDILTASQAQRQELRSTARENGTPHEDVRAEAERIREETQSALRELLTADQATLYDAIRTLAPDGPRGGRFHGRRAGHRSMKFGAAVPSGGETAPAVCITNQRATILSDRKELS